MPYRVGIIGCGSIGREHARAWQATPGVELVALADTHAGALAELAGLSDVAPDQCYTDYRQMLDRAHLDIVSICSWPGQHAEMVIAAAARTPRAILCEKPMAVCLGEADAMIIAAQRANVLLAISHMRRFYQGWEEARRRVTAGQIGTPRRLWTTVRDGLLNCGTHAIDGMRYVLGDPAAAWVIGNVERKTDRYERGVCIEDACVGVIAFASGAHAVVESDLTSGTAIGFEVVGTEGMLQVEEAQVRLFTPHGAGWQALDSRGAGSPETFSAPFAAQARGLVEWVDGVVEGEGFRNEARHGRAALEIMMAVYESARRHEVVHLPLQTRANPLALMVAGNDLPIERPGAYDIRSFLVRDEAMTWT